MKVVCVDDEQLSLDLIMDNCRRIKEIDKIKGFDDSLEALEYVNTHKVDVAFLDIDMPLMDGITLGKKMREKWPKLNVIMTTAYSNYALDAFDNDCSGYLIKPITADAIEHQLKILRFSVEKEAKKRVRLQCFGNFEVFIDNIPAGFSYSMSKEIVAILADRKGALCSNAQISAMLWEDGEHPEYFKSLRRDVLDTFKKAGCEDAIVHQRGVLGLNINKVDCDFWNDEDMYNGEYMTQYSWAEDTNSELHFKYGEGK
ncbi:MAG: response regulator [Lachnospiraceae bacterium]|nr:response regulator [Lachnospiraceae bacterium]